MKTLSLVCSQRQRKFHMIFHMKNMSRSESKITQFRIVSDRNDIYFFSYATA